MSTLPDGFFYENFSSSDEAPFSTPDSELQSFLPSNFAVATDMAQDGAKPSSTGDLVDRALLDKIDHLRRLDIGTPLPQIVVVGAQSSGKSSTLESITGFRFPHQADLCTRFATEIICRREDVRSINISIQPATGSQETHVKKAEAFHRTIDSLDGDEFAALFQDAAAVMGINPAGSAFSRDVLRVEISGPNEDHLTVIDVPGIFEHAIPGITTEEDIDLVDDMVKTYIRQPRTIILAVVPCNGDIANQKILRYSKEVDPDGKRTLGILTKPDLLSEQATMQPVLDLIQGKRRDLKLGYHVIRNRGADDTSTSKEKRDRDEEVFFAKEPWKDQDKSRIGVPALKTKLKGLLLGATKENLPIVKQEVKARLKDALAKRNAMGEPRGTPEDQRKYLSQIAATFRGLKTSALDGSYTRQEIFTLRPHLKLITRIRELNESFSSVLYEWGHTRKFLEDTTEYPTEDEIDPEAGETFYPLSFVLPGAHSDELDEILADPFNYPDCQSTDIIEHIKAVHHQSRAWEIGTFNPEALCATFRDQTSHWEAMTLTHVSNAILIVHHFIRELVEVSCPDDAVRNELWDSIIDELTSRYRKAMEHARFLLSVERDSHPLTVNPDFERALRETVARRETDRIKQSLAGVGVHPSNEDKQINVSIKGLTRILSAGKDKSEGGESRRIHDVLQSYYVTARARFADVVCQQAVDYFLLTGPDGPLQVLNELWVNGRSAAELENIAGEPAVDRNNREELEKEILGLETARKILMK